MASPKVGVDVPAGSPSNAQVVSPSTSSISVKSKNTKKVLAGLVVGAAVITAIAVPLASRNAASNSSSTASSKSSNQQVVVDVSTVGCADGTREWYSSSSTFTDIAGCAGAWTSPGLVGADDLNRPVPLGKTNLAQCSAIGNSATTNSTGTGCRGADLCAAGWHICASDAEVAFKSGGAGCDNANQVAAGGQGFFASAQTGRGNTFCDSLSGSFNDIFGCGTDGSPAVDTSCSPLTRFTHNVCSGFAVSGNGWNCGTDGYNEARALTHSTNLGGVLCCKDQALECTADANGWTVSGVDGFSTYLVSASGYSSSCSPLTNGTSLTIAASAEVPTEFLVSLYRTAGACSAQSPEESVYCPAYTEGGNEYQDA